MNDFIPETLEKIELILITLNVFWGNEYQSFEGIVLVVKFEYLLNEEIQFLLFLEHQARSKVVNSIVCHTHFSDQEVQQHNLHDENVRDEEEPGHAHQHVLVSTQFYHFIIHPILHPRITQVTNGITECLQHDYNQRVILHERIPDWIVRSAQNQCNHYEDSTESE